MLQVLVALAVLSIFLVILVSIGGVLLGMRKDSQMRADLADTVQAGALPPSLHPKIDLVKCIGSGSCVRACPETDVLAVLDGKAHVVNPTSCIGHGECLRACPVDAITLALGSERRGVDIPMVDKHFQTNVPGMYVVGELGGMGLIYNAMTQGMQCVQALLNDLPERVPGVHQVVVVGAGPAGIAASLVALDAGLDFVTVDQESVGGTVLHYPRQKLVMTRPVQLPLYGTVRVGEVRKEALLDIWNDILHKTGLTVRSGVRVEGVQREAEDRFVVTLAGGDTLVTQRVVLALGRRGTPRKLGVPGEEQGKVTYRLLEPERYAGDRVLVVGGGDSALEAACALAEQGAVVTLSYRQAAFSRAKKKNKARIEAKIQGGDVTFLPSSNVVEIHADTVDVKTGESVVSVLNDYVLVFAGGVLPTAFLESAGVEVQAFKGEAYAPANV